MLTLLPLVVATAGLARFTSAIAFEGPKPTPQNDLLLRALYARSPAPTPRPRIPAGLLKRQDATGVDTGAAGILDANSDTCGWDQYGDAVTCGIGTCIFYEPTGVVGMAGCATGVGDYSTCGWSNTCYDYDAISSKSQCNSDCFRDDFAWLCTNSATPYCQSWTYPGRNVKDYACGTDGASTYTTMFDTTIDTALNSSGTYTAAAPVLSGKEVTGWQTTTSSHPTNTGLSSTSGTSTPIQSPKKTSVGAIVGGAIGGVVLIALAAGLITFFVMKNKKKAQAARGQYGTVPGGSGDPNMQMHPQQAAQYGHPGSPQETYFSADRKEAVMANAYAVSPPTPLSPPMQMGQPLPYQNPAANPAPQAVHELQAAVGVPAHHQQHQVYEMGP